LHNIGLKAKAMDAQLRGDEVPAHIKLPNLEDILKMRQSLTTNGGEEAPTMNNRVEGGENDAKSFLFVAKHLIGAILGKKEWDNYKFRHWVTKHFTETDEAFLYVVLVNSYDLWKNTEGTRVGTGNLTRDGSNKKYCGWTKQGITMYNDILEKVRANCNVSWAQNVEDKVMETLRKRYNCDGGRNTNDIHRHKKRVREYDSSNGEEDGGNEVDADNDLSTVFAYMV
jgi:hypothetical protein